MSWQIELAVNVKEVNVVVGIIKKQDKILIAERPEDKPYAGYWEFPGGKIEPNETGEAALKRELYEELGIDIAVAERCFIHTHAYPDKTVQLEIWLVKSYLGEPHNKENQKLLWATYVDILEHKLLEGNWAIMEKIKKILD